MSRSVMFLMLFVMPEKKLSREQLANLQEMATGFGVLLARQMEGLMEEDDNDEADETTALAEIEAGEKIVDNPQIIDYLEGCLPAVQ